MRMTNSVRDLPAAIEKMEEALAQSKAAIPALQAQVKVWPKEDQLKEATARHAEVIEQLRPKKKTEAAEKPAADEPQLNDLAMDTAYSRLPEGNRIQLAARLRKLEQQKEQLTPEQYSEQLGELAGWLEEEAGIRSIKELKGLSGSLPLVAVITALSMISLTGLPPAGRVPPYVWQHRFPPVAG